MEDTISAKQYLASKLERLTNFFSQEELPHPKGELE
jgi:hypothetical protein